MPNDMCEVKRTVNIKSASQKNEKLSIMIGRAYMQP